MTKVTGESILCPIGVVVSGQGLWLSACPDGVSRDNKNNITMLYSSYVTRPIDGSTRTPLIELYTIFCVKRWY